MSDFDSVFTVSREISKEQFMRQLLIELASNFDSPNDVCTSSFGEITETERGVIVCDAHVDTSYTASVGYDRKEEYWDKEKKRGTNGSYYYVDVKKTRTVTDWSPYSGQTSGDAVCMAFNDEGDSDSPMQEHARLVPVMQAIKDENITEGGDEKLSMDGLNRAKECCVAFVESKVTFPGDHVKDKRINSTSRINSISCYKVPYYKVDFEYGGRTYKASGLACGKPNATAQLPPNNVDIKGTVSRETKPWKIGVIASWVATAICFVIAAILSGMDMAWFWGIFAAVAVAAIVVTVIGNSKYNKLLKQLQSDNKSQKLADLKAALAHYGFKELSQEEMSVFN